MLEPNDSSSKHDAGAGRRAASPSRTDRRIKMCVVATVDITIQNLYQGRLERLIEHGFDITVVCAPTPRADEITKRGVRLVTVPLRRAITPWTDLRCLVRLWRFFRRERFDLIEVSTPKAALLGSIAARCAGAPRVLHLLRGLVYQHQGWLQRRLLRWSQTIPCRLAHHVVGISRSLRDQAAQDGVCPSERMVILGEGSSGGVDLQVFSPRLRDDRAEVRAKWRIPKDAVVIGFVGRMTADKGLVELVDAFLKLKTSRPELCLLFVGDYEERDRPPQRTMDAIATDPQIRPVGWRTDTAPFFGAIDVLTLPSYREGFGNVLLHAAACGLPVVSTDATGCRDAMQDGVTGLRVPVGDTGALTAALGKLVDDAALRDRLGTEGRRWVERCFDQEKVWAMYEGEYRKMLGR